MQATAQTKPEAVRHISTLLAFLSSVEARTPGTLTENQKAICEAIARTYGDVSFGAKK